MCDERIFSNQMQTFLARSFINNCWCSRHKDLSLLGQSCQYVRTRSQVDYFEFFGSRSKFQFQVTRKCSCLGAVKSSTMVSTKQETFARACFSFLCKRHCAFFVSRFESGNFWRTYFKCDLVDSIKEEGSTFVGCLVVPCKVETIKSTKNEHILFPLFLQKSLTATECFMKVFDRSCVSGGK